MLVTSKKAIFSVVNATLLEPAGLMAIGLRPSRAKGSTMRSRPKQQRTAIARIHGWCDLSFACRSGRMWWVCSIQVDQAILEVTNTRSRPEQQQRDAPA